MKVTFIEHSGFLLDTGDAYFLFDYYKGKLPALDSHKPFTVFVSHKHRDHFNPEIFTLASKYPNIYYVLAKGVPYKNLARINNINIDEKILSIRKNTTENITLSNNCVLSINTLRSTDEGVAFLIDYNGRKYYHAGDLNLWFWEGETEIYNRNMTEKYLTEMKKLKGITIDTAFVPLDPRLEKYAFEGLKIFLEYAECSRIFPMHCWEDYSIIDKFLNKYPCYCRKIVRISDKYTTYS